MNPGKLHTGRKFKHRHHTFVQKCTTGLLSPKRTWPNALDNKLQIFANCDTRNCQAIKILRIFKIKHSTNQIRAVSRSSYVYFWKHCYRGSEFKILVRVRYWNFFNSALKNEYGLNQILWYTMPTYLKLWKFILNIESQKLTFLYEVYNIVGMSKLDLLIVLITTMCNMLYEISYLTQAELIIVAEIVDQSSCSKMID